MDIIICLASKDYHIIKKTIKYAQLYLQQETDVIYILTHKTNKIFFSDCWLREHHSVFLDENEILEGLTFESVHQALKQHLSCHIYPGWYLQQFLKMGFALTPYAKKQYLIWDSDTLPLRKMDFMENGKYLFTIKTENHKPYFDTLQKILGFGKLCNYSFIAEHMAIDVTIMRELIAAIENCNIPGRYWFEKIINATSGVDEQAFSEFETYGNYCTKYHPDIFHTRELRTLREAGMLFGRGVTQKELRILSKMNFDTASFELRDIPPFPYNVYYWWDRILLALYRRIGLVKK